MTATDELRALLDDAGVEWTAPNSILRDTMTCWTAGGFYYEAFEVPEPDGTFLLTAAHQDDLTPEQAVEATLGRGDMYTREECESQFVRGYSLGCLDNDEGWNENERELEDEMALLGWERRRGECHIDGGECDQCGAWVCEDAVTYWMPTGEGMRTVETHAVRYCPACGRRVVEVDA